MTLLRPIKPKKLIRKGILYKHCTLQKGNVVQVSWIPSEFAKIGEVLKTKQPDGSWDDGWVVKTVGVEEDEAFLDALRDMWKHHADVSDI